MEATNPILNFYQFWRKLKLPKRNADREQYSGRWHKTSFTFRSDVVHSNQSPVWPHGSVLNNYFIRMPMDESIQNVGN